MIRIVHPGSRIQILTFYPPGSRIQGSKRQRSGSRKPDPDPQHWFLSCTRRVCGHRTNTNLYEFRGNPCHSQQQNIAGSSRSCPSRRTSPHTWRRACHKKFLVIKFCDSQFSFKIKLAPEFLWISKTFMLYMSYMLMWTSNICNFEVIL